MRHIKEMIMALAAQLEYVLTGEQNYTPATTSGSLAYSPPFYPSPWMDGKAPEWAEAYSKARDFVSQLTLLEKVNLTTGVGWEGEQCVGQVLNDAQKYGGHQN